MGKKHLFSCYCPLFMLCCAMFVRYIQPLLLQLSHQCQFYKFNLSAPLFDGPDLVLAYVYNLIELWETLVVCKDETAKCLVFIRFGHVKVEQLVYAFYFKSAREDIFVVAY